MYLMVKEASKYDISVILGHGGDELLAGYWIITIITSTT